MAIAFRASGPISQVHQDLGLLEQLPGTYIGSGFNLIARPDKQNNEPFFLELNATHEILQFIQIGGDIPNRGSIQDDVNLHGVRYLQQVSDCTDHTQIHIEPGLWLHQPKILNPPSDEVYFRQTVVPHGASVLAQSTFFTTVNGGPQIAAVNSTPFTDNQIPDLNTDPTNPVNDPQYLAQFSNKKLPAECLPQGLDDAATIKNPALVLQAAIAGQNITQTDVIQISSAQIQNTGIVNIPFVVKNANTAQLDAIFWIERVSRPDGQGEFIQLQYVQRVILDFIGIHWPHISVATLVKQ